MSQTTEESGIQTNSVNPAEVVETEGNEPFHACRDARDQEVNRRINLVDRRSVVGWFKLYDLK